MRLVIEADRVNGEGKPVGEGVGVSVKARRGLSGRVDLSGLSCEHLARLFSVGVSLLADLVSDRPKDPVLGKGRRVC